MHRRREVQFNRHCIPTLQCLPSPLSFSTRCSIRFIKCEWDTSQLHDHIYPWDPGSLIGLLLSFTTSKTTAAMLGYTCASSLTQCALNSWPHKTHMLIKYIQEWGSRDLLSRVLCADSSSSDIWSIVRVCICERHAGGNLECNSKSCRSQHPTVERMTRSVLRWTASAAWSPLIKISTTSVSGGTSAAAVDWYVMFVMPMMAFVFCSPIFESAALLMAGAILMILLPIEVSSRIGGSVHAWCFILQTAGKMAL